MLTKIKSFLKKILPPPTATFLIIIDELADRILQPIQKITGMLEQQQRLLNQLHQENRNLNQKLQQVEEHLAAMEHKHQSDIASLRESMQKMPWLSVLCSFSQHAASWNAFAEKYPEESNQLLFLKPFYHLHDTLKETNSISVYKQEYVNTVLSACLEHLHSAQDPAVQKLIYDALKNQAFDDLELAGYDASFYTDQDRYQELRSIVSRPYDNLYFSTLSESFYEAALTKWYHQKTGQQLNLHPPITYNDKLNWLKLNERDPRKTEYADKYTVRTFVARTIGEQYLVPLLGVWEDPSTIDFDSLPDRFVLKANHGAGWNLIVSDKSQLNIPDSIQRMNWWLNRNYCFNNGLELHYRSISPKIIAEQYLENNSEGLDDYKVWCFDGKATFIQYLTSRRNNLKMAFYDTQWNKLPFITNQEQIQYEIEKPDNLDELISIAEKLASDFNHVRVDFYRLNSGEWKFGEMTFTPASGACKWEPAEYNSIIGNLFNLK